MEIKVIKDALQYLEKRINGAADRIVKEIGKIKFEQADIKVEKTVIDLAPVIKELQAIKKKEPVVVKEVQLSVPDNGDLLRAILSAVQANKPEVLSTKFDAMDEAFKGLKPKDSVKFDDKQMQGLMAALTGGRGVGGANKSALNWEVTRVVLTNADTEYSYTFPANTTSWTLKLRGAATFYYASATGKLPVSGDNTAYMTVPSRGTRSQDNVEWGGKTIYFESPTAGSVVEMEVFTM